MLRGKPGRPKSDEHVGADPGKPSARYAGVAIVPAGQCCEAVKARAGEKILATEAPMLPLRDCSMPMQCGCRFRKYVDRRDGEEDRRNQYNTMRSILYAGPERRKSPRRRRED